MFWDDSAWGWDGWLAMSLMMVFWFAVAGLAVWAVIRLTVKDHATTTTMTSPRATLDQRLASGEIDTEEYAHRRRVIDGRSVDQAPPVRGTRG